MRHNKDKLVTKVKALKQLGYCRAVVADMMNVPERTLNSWMLPETSKQYRRCPGIAVNMAQCLIDRFSPKKSPDTAGRYQS